MSVIERTAWQFSMGQDSGDAVHLRRESWLKALEDVGLRETLMNTKCFVDKHVHSGLAPETIIEGSVRPEMPLLDDGDRATVLSHEPANKFVQIGRGGAASAIPTARAETPAMREVGLGGCSVTAPRLGDGKNFGCQAALRLPVELVVRQTWEQRKVSVLPYEDGVEILVRDATLSETAAADFVGGLWKAASEIGASVKRVLLNGRLISTPDRGNSKNLVTREA